jgi:hypothetical protein
MLAAAEVMDNPVDVKQETSANPIRDAFGDRVTAMNKAEAEESATWA